MPRDRDLSIRISRRRLIGGFVAAGAATALPGLGTAVASAATGPGEGLASSIVGHLYVNGNTTGINTIDGFARHSDGSLSPLAGSPFAVGGAGNGGVLPSAGALAGSAGRRFLLAVDAGSNQVSVARITTGGALKAVAGSPFSSSGSKPVSITVHDRLVYVANAGDGGANYTGFLLGDDGRLTPLPGSTVTVPDGAGIGQVLFDWTGKHLVGVRVNTNLIDSFTIGVDGLPSAAPGSPFASQAAGPFGSVFRRGTYPAQLFVSNAHAGDGQGSVSAYLVSENGTLTPLPGSPYPNGQTATCWVALSPDRKYLFTSNTMSDSISSYRVANSGTLSLLGSTVLRGGSGLRAVDLGLDPAGRYLYQVENSAQRVAALAVTGGSLAELDSSPFALPANSSPWGIVVV